MAKRTGGGIRRCSCCRRPNVRAAEEATVPRTIDRPVPTEEPVVTSVEGAAARRKHRWLRVAPTALMGSVGLIVGLGVTFVALHDDGDSAPSVYGGPPSVLEIDRPAGTSSVGLSTAAETLERAAAIAAIPLPVPAVEPATPRAALDSFLTAEIADRSEISFALLDPGTQRDIRSVGAWRSTRSDRVIPERFSITSDKRLPDGTGEVTVRSTRPPSITLFRGLVAAESVDVWSLVRGEDGTGWRVRNGREQASEPQLPPDAGASAAAQRWIDGAARCDVGVTALQLQPTLLGAPEAAERACKAKGTWRTVGAPRRAAEVPDLTAFVAAYGPRVGRWGRGVLVERSDSSDRFTVLLGPVGQEWRVMGLSTAPPS